MNRTYIILLILLFAGIVKADNVTFQAVAPGTVVMGERFQLKYVVSGEDATDFRIPSIPDFDVLMGPSTSTNMSIQMINGVTTRSYSTTYTYVLLPKKEGTFTISPATIKVKGANYTSNELNIKVLPPDNQQSGARQQNQGSASPQSSAPSSGLDKNGLFARLILSKTSAYEQEAILATIKLYTLYDIRGMEPTTRFPEYEGFLVQDINLPDNKQYNMEHYNGRNYRTVVLKQSILYPQRPGKISIESGNIDLVVSVRSQRQTGNIFDDFFDMYQNVSATANLPSVTVEVKPLPSGKPASFSGSAGSYTMTSSISSEKVKANEAVTIRIKIAGEGNVKLIKAPEVEFPNDFEVYDPKIDSDVKVTAAGVSGSKSFEYYAIPRFAGEFDIPPVEFSYFDFKSGAYKTLKSQPFHLTVEKGEGRSATSGIVSNYTNKEQVRFLGEDIRYLKTGGFYYHKAGNYFFGSLLYWLWYIIPALLSAILFVVFRKKVKENSDIALRRTRKANKVATKRLKNASLLLKSGKSEEFYEELHKALWGYISDKLSIPFSELTKDNIESELRNFGVNDELIVEFIDILNTYEYARFAPSGSGEGMQELFERASKAIGKMENTIKR